MMKEYGPLVDTHCHILPNLDDGPSCLEDSVSMARAAVGSGIHTIVATPHHGIGKYENISDFIIKNVICFNKELVVRKIPLLILAGQEVRVHSQLVEELYAGKILTLNGTRFILLELPSYGVPSYFDELLHEVSILGLRPVIAHPERNAQFLNKPMVLQRYVEQGALCQITAQSVMGLFGAKIQRFTINLCHNNWVHVVASDAHNLKSRPFLLEQSYEYLNKRIGKEQVQYFKDNALKIVRDEEIDSVIHMNKKKSWFVRWTYRNSYHKNW
ncbi:tyrosine protein phosphatase [Paenibacillus sp. SYP-B3998]|uniref:Tyrosine-protein phosphatase n=2 Tax=Paenibacillus sp. SYP-B3998 TaxID=2678564 RepID=A0A6G3ZZN2_9BACL|nr:tyrosine protein phosphatase [Paenibacillus sp. SYP-B3998]